LQEIQIDSLDPGLVYAINAGRFFVKSGSPTALAAKVLDKWLSSLGTRLTRLRPVHSLLVNQSMIINQLTNHDFAITVCNNCNCIATHQIRTSETR
jgi:hypothetical protein